MLTNPKVAIAAIVSAIVIITQGFLAVYRPRLSKSSAIFILLEVEMKDPTVK